MEKSYDLGADVDISNEEVGLKETFGQAEAYAPLGHG
jgi:hypothetical protein